MTPYFPYSYIIINAANTNRKSMNKPSFVGDWSVCESDSERDNTKRNLEISEIYY